MPRLLSAALSSVGQLPSATEVSDAFEFAIPAASADALLGGGVQIDPCHLKGRTACPQHPQYAHICKIHIKLKSICDQLGEVVATTGDVLYCFGGTQPCAADGLAHQQVFALLSSVGYSPKFQVYTMCKATCEEDLAGQ